MSDSKSFHPVMASAEYHPPPEETACCGYPASAKCSDSLSSLLSSLGILSLVLIYTILGALTFMSLEATTTDASVLDLAKAPDLGKTPSLPALNKTVPTPIPTPNREETLRTATVEKLWKITEDLNILYKENWTKLAEKEMVKFERDIIRRYNLYNGRGADGHEWNFSNSFLYSLTLITTIGYGTVSAKTLWGRITTILYTLVGIPLMLIYLSVIGEALANYFRCFYGTLTKQSRKNPVSKQQNSLPNIYSQFNQVANSKYSKPNYSYCNHSPSKPRVRIPIVISFTIIISFILLGSLIFNKLENWTFLDGTFFCFTSLGTIGFGELIPGSLRGNKNISVLVSSSYILLGMAVISMCFNLIQEELIFMIKKFTVKLNKATVACDKSCDIS